MAFRTLDITTSAELHIANGQLLVIQEAGTVSIPVEDLVQINCIGANIRLSTMDLSILARNRVSLMTLDDKYLPTAISLPFEGNARTSQLIHYQIDAPKECIDALWVQIIRRKIENQSRTLSILGLDGAEEVLAYTNKLTEETVDYHESLAAKTYFQYYHPGLNRRSDDPVNSRLNYGYAVVRSAIIRALVAAGFHPAIGIHHHNQLDMFTLADDLIEPFRPSVDLVSHAHIGANQILSKPERQALTRVLHHAVMADHAKVTVLSAIEMMCESLKRIISNESSEQLILPTVLPAEFLEGVTE